MKYRIRRAPYLKGVWYVWLIVDDTVVAGPKTFKTWDEALEFVMN